MALVLLLPPGRRSAAMPTWTAALDLPLLPGRSLAVQTTVALDLPAGLALKYGPPFAVLDLLSRPDGATPFYPAVSCQLACS